MSSLPDKIEFEHDAPLELPSESELEKVSQDEVDSPSKTLDQVFKDKQTIKDERNKKIKEKKPGLKLRKEKPKVKKMKEDYKPKDYIAVECQLCQHEYTHAKKDDKGAFIPYALCQHVVFKGVFIE